LAGILTLLLDVLKGAAAAGLAAHFTGHSALWMVLAGSAALVGHCFPVWLAFKGGKGVAAALGVFVLLCPLAALAGFVLFLLVFVFWRYVSLASITAAAAMPLLVYLLWAPPHAPPLVVTFGTLFAAALVIYKHKANLRRLLSGTEPKYLAGKSKDGSV
jgi:glycerol-3-phosphate acyltransferase PlsY